MREIPLTRGKVAIVDDSDFYHLSRYRWYAHFDGTNWYARRQATVCTGSRATRRQRAIMMHRQILDAPTGFQVDHIDGNGLNNSRANLRLCGAQGNQRNKRAHAGSSSQFKGVSWYKRGRKWVVSMTIDGHNTHVGYFRDEEAAARAYDAAAKSQYGDFARLNFPDEGAA